ncbi:hypothetical protein ACOSP7_013053 [Xanthoceras sorbifolium]
MVDKLFDVVVMTDITETPNIKSIQGQIADELGLKFHEKSLSGRDARLRNRLKKEKRVLVVLDNIWAQLDLEVVGIPLVEEEKGSVTQKDFFVNVLSREEAGHLFWKIVVDSAKRFDLDSIAIEIIRCCAGLPVAIATVSSSRHIKGMDANVRSAIKLSYDFLYNASADINIDYLLKYGMGLNLFQDISTFEQGRNRLHTLINKLKASCLLLDSKTNKLVKMHDIVHAVSISIASTQKHMFNIQDITDLKEMLEEKLPKDSTAISLQYKDVSMLPERLACPKLKLLMLLMKDTPLQILHSFFEGIDIRQLTRLRFLDLRSCSKLKVISPNVISSLTWLEELYVGNNFVQWDVEGGSNASLSELKQLFRLTTLDIRVLDARIMPQNLLVFEKLERYRILIKMMLKLQLNNSNIYLGSGIKILLNRTENLYLNKLKGVKNVVYQLNGEGFLQLKHLYVENGPEIQYIIRTIRWGIWNVFPKLKSLFLHKLVNLEKVHHGRLAIESFNKLRIMKVGKCDRLKYLLSFSMAKNLMQLQEIKVTDCKMLEEIVFKESKEQVHQNDRISRVEFTQLHTLTIQRLPWLISFGFNLFTPSTGSQEIIIEDDPSSSGFTSLFSQNVMLPSLENLKLSSINIGCTWFDQLLVMSSCCRSLTNLTLERCKGSNILECPSLTTIQITYCPKMETFVFPNTKDISTRSASLFNEKLCGIGIQTIWHKKLLAMSFMAEILLQLKVLEISNCKFMKGVIVTEELISTTPFPKLNQLKLKNLPELTRFYNFLGNSIKLPTSLEIFPTTSGVNFTVNRQKPPPSLMEG